DLARAAFRPGTGRLSRLDLVRGEREVLLEGLSRPVTVVPMADGTYVVVESGGGILRLEAGP
ncbi:MAG: ScyD/ScyE family protein, partial [Proteobacteria bacterium]|nr:ScyD/ScyE family protein [Pseudomonadota bacterium]